MARDEGAEVGSRDGTGDGEVTRSQDAATGPGLEHPRRDPSIEKAAAANRCGILQRGVKKVAPRMHTTYLNSSPYHIWI